MLLESLLNLTSSNSVELIVTIIVLDFVFSLGESKFLLKNKLEQEFSLAAAQMTYSVLTLACISLVLPSTFRLLINYSFSNIPTIIVNDKILHISYGASIVEQIDKEEKELKAYKPDIVINFANCNDGDYYFFKIVTFIALVLLPIVGHGAKYANAVNTVSKNKMDSVLIISVGSSTSEESNCAKILESEIILVFKIVYPSQN
ncbi:21145_t:CDS:2 [Dentiscutata erythropus]|uniref:21145_t:CDS:1 n=1 Tax=Dentiscutata erythropus TaxID=1348616 RepID=A0A9N8YNP1_9GLOM|nr:21145_t:CDS:2 [Dentiscutata erythropus]